jgi:hypothetical protein
MPNMRIVNIDGKTKHEGLLTVECGLEGNCFYHTIGWLCHVSLCAWELPGFTCVNVSLALGHLRVLHHRRREVTSTKYMIVTYSKP